MRQYLAAVTVTIGLLTAGCGGAPQEISPVVITTLDGYELKGDPVSAIEYSGNTNIFFGEVTGYRKPRKVERVSDAGDRVSYIYTPIVLKVAHVYLGDWAKPGRMVTLRALGGQIGREKTVSETSPPPGAYQLGMKVYVFAPDFVDAGDGLVACTPNFLYAEDTIGQVYNLHEPEHKHAASSFFMMISEHIAWSRPQSGG